MPENRFDIPKVIFKEFQTQPRIVIKHHPAGLWPVPLSVLKKADFFKTLANDKQFTAKYDVVIVPKR